MSSYRRGNGSLSLVVLLLSALLTIVSEVAGADTLSVWVVSIDAETGQVNLNGVESAGPSGGAVGCFTWEWGDGTATRGCFPQTHTYADTNKNYVVRVTSHYTDGNPDYEEVDITFGVYSIVGRPDPYLEISIPDANLKQGICSTLGLQGAPILTRGDMRCLISLDAVNRDISDLTGLEHASSMIWLNLARNPIDDISVLSLLDRLEHLHLSDIGNADFASLSSFVQLRALSLAWNDITDISFLENLTNLTSLDIAFNAFDNVEVLSGMTDLNWLNLTANPVDDVSVIFSMNGLEHLHLSDIDVMDFTFLSSFVNLRSLSLSWNNLTDISFLANLTHLTSLDIAFNTIDSIEFLSGMGDLTWLNLTANSISDISALSSLNNLETLHMSSIGIADVSPLSGCTRLRILDLRSNSISNLEGLLALTGLDELQLDRNPLAASVCTDQIPRIEANNPGINISRAVCSPLVVFPDENLKAAVEAAIGRPDPREHDMADLTVLRAYDAGITDLTGIEYAANLTELRISRCSIGDWLPLIELKSLTTLAIIDSGLSDISFMAEMPNLEKLFVSDNEIADLSPLSRLENLSELFLDNNPVESLAVIAALEGLKRLSLEELGLESIEFLENLVGLTDLHLGNNNLEDISPLGNLTGLEVLSLGYDYVWGQAGNPLDDLSPLANLQNLETLRLSYCQVTTSDLDALRGLNALKSLHLQHNGITDISVLSSLTNLEALLLSYNPVRDASILALPQFEKLQSLTLGGLGLDDISFLSNLKELRYLRLYENRISDLSPLLEHTNLTRLDLENNRLNSAAYTTYIPQIEANNPLDEVDYNMALIVAAEGSEYTRIQDAIDAFSPDTDYAILVTDGFYTGPGNTDLDFGGKSIYLYSDNGSDNCEIFCDGQTRAFSFRSGEDANSVIDGFTISGGADVLGSAVYCEGAVPTLANCVIEDNGPSSLWISDVLHIEGTVQIESGAIEGPGSVELEGNSVLQVRSCPINCSILGSGRLEILPGAPAVLTGTAQVDLAGLGVLCNGKLRVQDSGVIQNTTIEVPDSGSVYVLGNGSLLNCEIHSTSDKVLTVDSLIPVEALAETDVFVTLSGEANFEVRGRTYCIDAEDPLCGPGAHQLVSVPVLDANTLTLSRLELASNVTVTLTDHFRDQADSPYDVLYVQDLVLGEGAQLNLAGKRLYYETLVAEPDQIVDQKIYVDQLAQADLSDPSTFRNDVTTNNTPDQTFVSLVDSPDVAPEPVVYLQDHDEISARAKAYLGRFSEDDIIVSFSYLFNSDDPEAVLEVYLSDEEGLLPLDDPNMLLAGRFMPPILGCPGSMESGEFALFSLPVTVTPLDPNQGLWLELILSEPSDPLGGFGFITMGDGRKGGAYARDLTLSSRCLGICMDLTQDGRVEVDDYTLVGASAGRSVDSQVPPTSPLSCIDRGYSRDGRADIGDVVGLADLMVRGGLSDVMNLCSIPMAWEDTSSQVGSTFISFGETEPFAAPAAQTNSDLLFLGKGSTDLLGQEFLGPEDLLYGFDDISAASQQYTLTSNVGQVRLVRGDPNVMILDSDQGLCQLNGDVVVGPGRHTFDGKTVTIGVRKTGDDQLSGRPLRDAAFHNGFAYVVPVIVEESGGILYQAAAKLELTGGDYDIKQLYYDSALAPFSNQSPNLEGLREIEVDRSGRVYLLNAHYQNSSDMLWAFDNMGALLSRHFLNRLSGDPVENPVGLCYDMRSNRLYMASGVFDKADPNQSMLYGYTRQSVLSGNALSPIQEVTAGNIQHITDISSDQQGTLWVTGFKLTETPDVLYATSVWNPDERPLPGPRLALVHTSEDGASQIEAESLYEDMGIVLPTSILYVSVPSGPVPLALWRFDELGGATAQDETGNYPGTIHGALPTEGILSGALQFDGVDDYVDCGSRPGLAPEAMTLSLWMYPDETKGFLIHKSGTDSSSKEYELYMSPYGVKVTIGGEGKAQNSYYTNRLSSQEWLHVALTYGDGTLSVYANGVLTGSADYDFAVTDGGHVLSIGGGNTNEPFKGKIDNVVIYDSVLSEDEVFGLFEEGQ